MKKDIKPIILLGAARSGTTWLSNLILEKFPVASPFHRLHYGILETNILRHKEYFVFRNYSSNVNTFYNVMTAFLNSDLAIALNSDQKKCLGFDFKQAELYDLFFDLLDDFTIKQGKETWMTKIDPLLFIKKEELTLFLSCLKKRYKEVKFISIVREYHENQISYMNVTGPKFQSRKTIVGSAMAHLLGAARYRYFNNSSERIIREFSGLALTYDQLLKDKAGVMEKVSSFFGMPMLVEGQGLNIPKNTSKQNEKVRYSRAFSSFCHALFAADGLSHYFLKTYEKARAKNCPFEYRITAEKYNTAYLEKYFDGTGDLLLKELIEK